MIFTQGTNTSCTQRRISSLHGSLPQGGQCPAEEKFSSHWGNLSKFWRLLVPALITLVMISNPAAVVGRPEANGHAPVPPHDALYTRFNPPKEVLLHVNKLIVYHINMKILHPKYQSPTVVDKQQEKISPITSDAQQTFWFFISI